MKHAGLLCLFVAGAVCLTGCPPPVVASYTGEFTSLSGAYHLNDAGEIAGVAYVGHDADGDHYVPAVWQDGNLFTLDPGQGFVASAVAVSNSHAVLGLRWPPPYGPTGVVIWLDGVAYAPTLGGEIHVTPYAINVHAKAVGACTPAGAEYHVPTIWTSSGVQLVTPPEGFSGSFIDINDADTVVGQLYNYSTHESKIVLWKNGHMSEVETLGGDCEAGCMNNRETIAGDSLFVDTYGVERYCPWVNYNGTVEALPCPEDCSCFPLGINDDDQVVGYAELPAEFFDESNCTALLWQRTSSGRWEMYALDDLLVSDYPGLKCWTAVDINNSGRIVTGTVKNGTLDNLLLTPVH